MAKGARHGQYRHGLFSGWNDYRHGSDAASRVTLAPIFNAARRDGLADRVAHLMQDWRLSPFEFEGPIRHELRSMLCLAGNSWARSEAEAVSIVGKAIDTLGIERPSFEEGQRDHSGEYEYCSWCACPIDEERRTRGQRFCCVECAKAAVVHREPMNAVYEGMVLRSAARMIERSRVPPRPCQQCGHMFQTEREDAIFCSPKCVGDSRRVVPDAACEECGTVFRPQAGNRDQRFCSLRCRSVIVERERKAKANALVFQCAECGKDFTPQSERARHCSARCGSKERNRLYKARGGQASAYAYTCKCCGVGFTSRLPKSPYCSKPCRDLVERYESDKCKRITARVFDYMLHRDGVPMTGLHITDKLFA